MEKTSYHLITILGATASGKTSFAANLAYKLDGEIISADSRQVYKKMNIGTGKDYDDYYVNGLKIPYHLVDIVDAGYKYSVYEYQRDFLKAYYSINKKSKLPVLCGGSGMYIDAAVKGYKLIHVPPDMSLRKKMENNSMEELIIELQSLKELHNISDTSSKKRLIRAIEIQKYYEKYPEKEIEYPRIDSLFIGIKFDRDSRRKRISERLKQRLESGMVEEVKDLLDSGIKAEDLIFYGLEYKYITQHIIGDLSFSEMFLQLETAIHQFAKRQMTWFRSMEKKGIKIHWLDGYMSLEDKISASCNLIYNKPDKR